MSLEPLAVARVQRLFERAMGQRDGHRAVSDRAADPLGRPVAGFAGREQPRNAGLQRQRVAVERPLLRGVAAVARRSGPVRTKPAGPTPDPGVTGPARAWLARRCRRRAPRPAAARSPRPPPSPRPPRAGRRRPPSTAWDLGPQPHLDVGMRRDPIGPGSPTSTCRGSLAADQHRHSGAGGCRGTSRPGRPSCQPAGDDVVIAALGRLAAAGAVVDAAFRAAPRCPRHSSRRQTMPGGGDHDVGASSYVAARRRRVARVSARVDAGCRSTPRRMIKLGAEALGLPPGEPRELGAADPVREAEEVLDQRGMRRLAAGDVALERRPSRGRRRRRTRPPRARPGRRRRRSGRRWPSRAAP